MNLVFLGPPGAGKGTQAEKICAEYGLVQVSTGNILRRHKKLGTPIGIEADRIIADGNLVPDGLIIDMMKEELSKPYLKTGYILDGFPRTLPQAVALDEYLARKGETIDCTLVLNVETSELVKRISGRRTCRTCGRTFHLIYNPPIEPRDCEIGTCEIFQRADDSEEAVKNRLRIYAERTLPLIDYYSERKLAVPVDGSGSMDEVYARIKVILDKLLK